MPPLPDVPTPCWTVVIPVKRLIGAKSRLSAADRQDRADLALAFATDVANAAMTCARVRSVFVVSSDEQARTMAAAAGIGFIFEYPATGATTNSLNAAILQGARTAAVAEPSSHTAIVAGDLPCATDKGLDALLRRAEGHQRGFVADHLGTGTTILTARTGEDLQPAFGNFSAQAHRDSGAVDLSPVGASGLRLDVDTVADLVAATALGLGPATSQVVARMRLEDKFGVGTIVAPTPNLN